MHADIVKVQLSFKGNIRMGKKCDLWLWNDCLCQTSWFEYLNVPQKLLISRDFHAQQSLKFTESGVKNENLQ